jgi:hypothetical protein
MLNKNPNLAISFIGYYFYAVLHVPVVPQQLLCLSDTIHPHPSPVSNLHFVDCFKQLLLGLPGVYPRYVDIAVTQYIRNLIY